MRGLYLITNDDAFDLLYQKLHIAMQNASIGLIQYRRKNIVPAMQLQEVDALLQLCQRYQVPLVINDNLALAQQFDCGLHLGQGDGSLVKARAQLGAQAIIGRTCHDSLALATQAANDGASYLAFGAVFPSTTKPHAQRVSLATLQQAKAQFALPICVIGGLTIENIQPLIALNIDLYAVVGDVLNLSLTQVAQRSKAWQVVLSN
ncbi:MAG: thiamine phosphate synthase [Moraxellaceae bacterium]|nr:MAG: thiamine phosphate synthase [Moraxellaceae bacterium]